MALLSEHDVVRYLLRHALISPRVVVEGDLDVLDASARHSNFKVLSESGPCYLVKQAVDPERAATLAREARTYRTFESLDGTHPLRTHLARLHRYDPQRDLLVLELLRDAEDLRERYHSGRPFSCRHAVALGEALAAVHAVTPAASGDGATARVEETAWVLSLHRPDSRLLDHASNASLRIVGIIQEQRELCDLLDSLRGEWQPTCLVHADLRWSNCLLARSARRTVVIVDWELGGEGDPCWDVGSIFSEYLSWWFLCVPIAAARHLQRVSPADHRSLARAQQAIRAFWLSYARRRGLSRGEADGALVRAMKFCAARLVQTAYEQVQTAAEPSAHVVCLLQLSLNILRRPHEALASLCGIVSHA